MHTKKKIEEQLTQFHQAVGHHVHVHSSLKMVGDVEGNGEGLLDSLISYFTQKGGMISFPTHTWHKNVLNLREKETCTGMLGRLAMERKDGVRTKNPTHSMVIFGSRACQYAKWDETVTSSTSPNGCYGKLYEEDGYIMLLGVGQNKNTYIHAVEEDLAISNRVTKDAQNTILIETDGTEVIKPMHLVYEELGDISAFFDKLEPAFRYHDCILDGKIGEADVQLCSVRKMYHVLEMIHQRSNYVELFLDDKRIPIEWYQN